MAWLSLAGKRAIVTGGGSGIGKAAALGLLRVGADVTILDRNQSAIDKVVSELAGEGKVSGCAVDVSSTEQVAQAWEHFGSQDVLVNAAGITRDGWMTRMDSSAWDEVLNVNLKGSFLMTQAFARQWKLANSADAGGSGSVINISSIIAKTGNMGQTNYAASKAGVVGFTKAAAKELAGDRIRVNVILPGFIATPMTETVPDKVIAKILPTVPQGRMGEASEIADSAVFLASDRSSYITGSVFEVTGGLSM